jgi:heme exporter protein C
VILIVLTLLALIGVIWGVYLALFGVGADATQGNVQRIFYLHVPTFFGAFIAFATTTVGGALYLKTRNLRWDHLAVAGVEVGFVLSLITLLTGMVWARPIWNTWWTWDWRLTSMAVMVLTYAAYLMLRGAVDNGDKKRTLTAIYGILAIGTVLFTLLIIRVRPDTIHPAVVGSSPGNAEGGFAMTTGMRTALMVNMFVWCCFVTPALLWWRVRLEALLDRVAVLRLSKQLDH